jgi:uncharacterized protein (TIGR04255 family)
MPRPSHLPDYGSPPLNEVALGIQYRPVDQYQQILAGEVWKLFKSNFPIVEEHPPLDPSFETFGPPEIRAPQFKLLEGAQHDRFWFLSERRDELIQFQSDRLLHNWRKPDIGPATVYPRFETMIEQFTQQAQMLGDYFYSLSKQQLEVTQCEVNYTNHLILDDDQFSQMSDYIKVMHLDIEPEDTFFRYRRVIEDQDDKKIGRLYCEAQPALKANQQLIISLALTVRGAPSESTIESALAFMREGRDRIVHEFTTITTDKAHKFWERIR